MARSAMRSAVPGQKPREHGQNSSERDRGDKHPPREHGSDIQGPGCWPAPGTIRGRWTASDLETLPDDGLRYELVDGALVVSPSPTPYHQRAGYRLQRILDDASGHALEVLAAPIDWQPDEATVV